MTDAIIEAEGDTIEEAFKNSAIGLVNTMFDLSNSKIDPDQEIKIMAEGFDLKNLLYDWLEKVMLTLLVDHIILVEFEFTLFDLKDNKLECKAKGEKINLKKHDYKVEIKSVTYHEMDILKKENGGYILKFLLDL